MNDAGRIGFVLRGDYTSTDTYDFLDVVFYGGASYVAKKLTVGNVPSKDSEYWQILAEGGSLSGDSDISDTSVSFEEAQNRVNVASGDKMSTFAGKIKKWFSDLKDAAFYDVTDELTQEEAGQAVLDAAVGKWLDEHKLDKDNVIESTEITEPGFVMDGKTASDAFAKLNSKLGKMLYSGTLTKESANINIPEMSKYNVFTAILASSYISGAVIGVRRDPTSITFVGASVSGTNAVPSRITLIFENDTFKNYEQYSVWGQSATGISKIRGIV